MNDPSENQDNVRDCQRNISQKRVKELPGEASTENNKLRPKLYALLRQPDCFKIMDDHQLVKVNHLNPN